MLKRINGNVSNQNTELCYEHDKIQMSLRDKESQIFDQEMLIKDLHKKILEYRQRLMKVEMQEGQSSSNSTSDLEMYRLREILDVLNKRIEELRIIVSKEDEHSTVSANILLDKDEFIKVLKKQLRELNDEQENSEPGHLSKRESNKGMKKTSNKSKSNGKTIKRKNPSTYSASSSINQNAFNSNRLKSSLKRSGTKYSQNKASRH
jgi:hypothetical protein